MHMKSSAIPAQYARFAELIGMEGTQRLLELYGGEAAALPATRQLKRVRRDNEILKLYRQGLDKAAIGRRFGISRRAVNAITLRGWAFAVEDYEAFMKAQSANSQIDRPAVFAKQKLSLTNWKFDKLTALLPFVSLRSASAWRMPKSCAMLSGVK